MRDFLPTTKEELVQRGWNTPDFLYITGDAYVDHPSFGHAIISRVLEANGYSVGIVAQPDWRSTDDFKRLGKPRLGVLVTSGNIDSMVNHYTAAKKPRSEDLYSPGGEAGHRPDRAVIVYCNRIREAFGDIPIIIGGIEASLRRFAHYDYWDNKVRRSVLLDSRADLLIYGMGEKQIVQIADALEKGIPVKKIRHIDGTCFIADKDYNADGIVLDSFETVSTDKPAYAKACRIQYEEQDPIRGKRLIQPHHDKLLVQNPPMLPLNTKELDAVYALPYMRTYHPSYEEKGGIPAIAEVKFSITSCRGCYGACNFCALTFHQGRIVQSRSHESILAEAQKIIWEPDFKGYIHDVGGPTADFRKPACQKQLKSGACKNRQCLFPTPCKNLEADHSDYLALLRKLRSLDRVKKVFVRSGLRYDYIMADKDDTFFTELCEHHVSGQLKVAPEHVSENVLMHMGKPGGGVYKRFSDKYYKINEKLGKKQYLVPYLMSSHPGSTLKDAVTLSLFLRDNGLNPQQVQDFYPTPGTISTAMFYTGIDPYTGKSIYVAKTPEEKAMQRALLQYKNPANHNLVRKALRMCGREDLIGFTKNCLVRPEPGRQTTTGGKQNGNSHGRKGTFQKNKGKSGGRSREAQGKRR
ncbi:MAG: YgiQ family radical SAM protein [Clostridia bacterium]|nr:YgiQ family radical SAM protein [Clostridia bacterium]